MDGSSSLATGTVTVKGEGFPTTVINFGRAASLTVTLAGAAKWGQAGVSPSADIDKWAHEILKQSGGVATDIIFTTTAWTNFILDEVVKTAIWYPNNGGKAMLLMLALKSLVVLFIKVVGVTMTYGYTTIGTLIQMTTKNTQ
jgi:hypothetical protein